MKKLIDLLRENLEEETMEIKEIITKNYEVVDEVGKFFVVSKPGTKSKKEGRPDYIDGGLDFYYNQFNRNDVEVTRRIGYNPYVSNSSWGFEDGDGSSMRDLLRRLHSTD
jgi:hypothetical protein